MNNNENVRIITTIAAQGDVLIRRIKALPEGLIEVKHEGDIVIAHSETGHNHIAVAECPNGLRHFQKTGDTLNTYLQIVESDSFEVKHLRSYDTHQTLKFLCKPGDVFEVRRQREHTPEGWQMIRD